MVDKLRFCRKCGDRSDIVPFVSNSRNICRNCYNIYQKERYSKIGNKYQDKISSRNKRIRVENLKFLYEWYNSHPCVDCGESDYRVLEFDHLYGKKDLVSKLAATAYCIETIKKEIAKCEVRCSNCHRKKSFIESNGYTKESLLKLKSLIEKRLRMSDPSRTNSI